MGDDIFAMAMESIRKEPFDNTRIVLAEQIAGQNYFTTTQIKNMAMVFTADDGKLAFAEYAYTRTVAKSNYFNGLSRPMNLPFPRRKSIALKTFLFILSSVFRNEIYLMISVWRYGGR
jgi:hypothetical protein